MKHYTDDLEISTCLFQCTTLTQKVTVSKLQKQSFKSSLQSSSQFERKRVQTLHARNNVDLRQMQLKHAHVKPQIDQ